VVLIPGIVGKIMRVRRWKSSNAISNEDTLRVIAICLENSPHQNAGATSPNTGLYKVTPDAIQHHRLTGIS
jgi:hypothetical protein